MTRRRFCVWTEVHGNRAAAFTALNRSLRRRCAAPTQFGRPASKLWEGVRHVVFLSQLERPVAGAPIAMIYGEWIGTVARCARSYRTKTQNLGAIGSFPWWSNPRGSCLFVEVLGEGNCPETSATAKNVLIPVIPGPIEARGAPLPGTRNDTCGNRYSATCCCPPVRFNVDLLDLLHRNRETDGSDYRRLRRLATRSK